MKKNIYLVLATIFLSFNVFSQSVGITDFMRLNPYSNLSNPAYFIPYNGYVGIPGAANINFSLYNTSFLYKNLFEKDKNGYPVRLTPNKFVNSMHATNNWLNTNLDLEMLGFGFRVKQFFFTFGYRIKMDEQFRYNKDLFGFLLQGNLAPNSDGDYLYTKASPAELEISPNINIYQEMSIGFQGQIGKRLYIGARPKILFGLVNIKTDKFGAKLYNDPNLLDYTICGNYDVDIKMASAIPFYAKDVNGKIMFSSDALNDIGNDIPGLIGSAFKNVGFAIDLGAVYRINQQIRVSASVTDLGFIKWREGSALNILSKPREIDFEFSGLTTEQITNFVENGIDINLDTLFNIFNHNFDFKSASYTTLLTSKIMLDAFFDLTPSNRFILQFKGYIVGKHFLPQLSIAYNGTFFNLIDVVVSYSMMRNSFANLGIGLGFRMGPVHIYAGTDNVLAAVNVLNATRANVTAGLLINFPIKRVKEPELNSIFKKKEKVQAEQEENIN